jgi:4a-hydroxytetrahydrobiopterin dehydratase
MKEPVLDQATVEAALEAPDGPQWQLLGGKLVKVAQCVGFLGALAFVGEVGLLAEAANHHPDIDIRYRTVTLALVTHDSGGITRRDLDLARAIDEVRTGLPDEPPGGP